MNYIPSLKYESGQLTIVDQTRLPVDSVWLPIHDLNTACEAIVALRVRGAPAIGVMAALSSIVVFRNSVKAGEAATVERFLEICNTLRKTRPTAVNLFYAMDRMSAKAAGLEGLAADALQQQLEDEAVAIYREDVELCDAIGRHGASLIKEGATVLTHCNTGSLATAGRGTALGAIYTAFFEEAKKIKVINTETRPLLQGARLTSYELVTAGIPTTLITDSMAAMVMKQRRVDLVMVGADRIARNGDSANKIGTLALSILAKHYGIPFYVLAPSTTIDTTIADGSAIVIEERTADEVRSFGERRTAPANVNVFNPAFDVAPADLISGIVTEKGVFRGPYDFR
ncbi:MAG: S-methyl-5-thioribose-1-phosphate isomerase [Leptonema illini]|uniref:Methylthioribose-1-phosphate isomerase n=1 Tax=Leptonema illini TaxID=183 RepID=A0A833H015_9LEPT|nr:MAG: S-methyl-5-thioribose-1-phosphate isomerase [Leptonema illini]